MEILQTFVVLDKSGLDWHHPGFKYRLSWATWQRQLTSYTHDITGHDRCSACFWLLEEHYGNIQPQRPFNFLFKMRNMSWEDGLQRISHLERCKLAWDNSEWWHEKKEMKKWVQIFRTTLVWLRISSAACKHKTQSKFYKTLGTECIWLLFPERIKAMFLQLLLAHPFIST